MYEWKQKIIKANMKNYWQAQVTAVKGMVVHGINSYTYVLMQKHIQCKKVWPGKVDSYLEVKAWTDCQQQDIISQYGWGLVYTEHIAKYYTGHIRAM